MAFIAEGLTAGLNPQNSKLSRARRPRRRRTADQTRAKAVPEEVKFDVRILAFTLPVFAVDDFGFRRMHLQVALRQPGLQLSLEGLRFLPGTAVHQPVVRIPTPWKIRMCPRHPEIKRVVHKKIGQNWADHSALRRAAASPYGGSLFLHHRRLEPSFDVQQRPLARYVFPNGS